LDTKVFHVKNTNRRSKRFPKVTAGDDDDKDGTKSTSDRGRALKEIQTVSEAIAIRFTLIGAGESEPLF
jgi:hypothetical protein